MAQDLSGGGIMTPRNENNFLVEVTKEIWHEVNRLLSEEETDSIEVHYSPYWKELKDDTK